MTGVQTCALPIFCADPINLLTEKHFLIRKFYLGLYAETQKVFQQAFFECEIWLEDVMSILKLQMADHKTNLNHRAKTLSEANIGASELQQKIASSEQELMSLSSQSQVLDLLLLSMLKAVKTPILQTLELKKMK